MLVLMRGLFFAVCMLLPLTSFSSEKIIISEQTLRDLVNDNVPSVERINTMVVQSSLEMTRYNQKYSPFVNAAAGYEGVDGKMFSGYNGNFNDPADRVGVSINQNLPIGMSFDVGLYNGYAKSFSYSPYGDFKYSQYDSNLEAKLSIDLWKNLLGYSERAERLGLRINEKEKAEQAKLEKVKFYNELRKIYWNLNVSNSLIKVYEALIKQAEIQEENIKRMYKSSIADKGDLARATAVVNIRKSDLLSIKYNMEQLKQQLSNLIPVLNNKELVFQYTNYENSKDRILACFRKIKTENETPFHLSSYTRLIGYKDEKIKANLKSLDRYSDMDVKLEARAGSLGFGSKNGDSFNDMAELDRRDYSVALNVSMPFGSNYSDTKENQMKLLKMQYNIEKKEIVSNMISFHDYFSATLNNLFQMREQQKEYRDNLLIRVKSMRIKYNQGRIALSDLIQDEDSLFESEVGIIRTNYNIVALMIDYFTIFNDVDCDFNIKI